MSRLLLRTEDLCDPKLHAESGEVAEACGCEQAASMRELRLVKLGCMLSSIFRVGTKSVNPAGTRSKLGLLTGAARGLSQATGKLARISCITPQGGQQSDVDEIQAVCSGRVISAPH